MSNLVFNAYSVRRIDNPNTVDTASFGEDAKNFKYFVLLVSIFQIPDELKDWREINPRNPNTDTSVSKAIAKTLDDPEAHKAFFLRNRGLTILAEDLTYNNQTGEVQLSFSNKEKHGLLDGGHTFEVIREYLQNNPQGNASYVKLEIFTQGDIIDSVTEITGGRNRSTNVPEIALVAHEGHLKGIKEILSKEQYYSDIAWKPNEVDSDGSDKKIHLIDILSYLECFDVFNYPNFEKNPIFVYSTKGNVPKKFNDDEYRTNIEKITHLLPDILKLRDWIVRDIPQYWRGDDAKSGYGSLREVQDSKGKATPTPFTGGFSTNYVTNAYYYPILAAFRSLVAQDNETGLYTWRYDLQTFYDRVFPKLIHDVKDRRRYIDNVNQLGKDNTLWTACYKTARMEMLEMQQKDNMV